MWGLHRHGFACKYTIEFFHHSAFIFFHSVTRLDSRTCSLMKTGKHCAKRRPRLSTESITVVPHLVWIKQVTFSLTYVFWLKLNNREYGGSMGFGSYKILIAVENYAAKQSKWNYTCYPQFKDVIRNRWKIQTQSSTWEFSLACSHSPHPTIKSDHPKNHRFLKGPILKYQNRHHHQPRLLIWWQEPQRCQLVPPKRWQLVVARQSVVVGIILIRDDCCTPGKARDTATDSRSCVPIIQNVEAESGIFLWQYVSH